MKALWKDFWIELTAIAIVATSVGAILYGIFKILPEPSCPEGFVAIHTQNVHHPYVCIRGEEAEYR